MIKVLLFSLCDSFIPFYFLKKKISFFRPRWFVELRVVFLSNSVIDGLVEQNVSMLEKAWHRNCTGCFHVNAKSRPVIYVRSVNI